MKSFYQECMRVLKVARKPTMVEFKTVAKVAALGIAVIGFIGFLIFTIHQVIL